MDRTPFQLFVVNFTKHLKVESAVLISTTSAVFTGGETLYLQPSYGAFILQSETHTVNGLIPTPICHQDKATIPTCVSGVPICRNVEDGKVSTTRPQCEHLLEPMCIGDKIVVCNMEDYAPEEHFTIHANGLKITGQVVVVHA